MRRRPADHARLSSISRGESLQTTGAAHPQYADDLSVRDARARYFADNGFGEGGYDARWVVLRAGPIPIYLPNTKARVAAVKLHDVHHPATGYETTWTGEAEIGAWEIASGCARHLAAWVLNLQAMSIGLVLAPRAILRAFVRGRRSRNLYREQLDETLLASRLGDLRHRLRLDRPVPAPTAGDLVAFGLWSIGSVATLAASVAVALLPLAGLGLLAAGALRT